MNDFSSTAMSIEDPLFNDRGRKEDGELPSRNRGNGLRMTPDWIIRAGIPLIALTTHSATNVADIWHQVS